MRNHGPQTSISSAAYQFPHNRRGDATPLPRRSYCVTQLGHPVNRGALPPSVADQGSVVLGQEQVWSPRIGAPAEFENQRKRLRNAQPARFDTDAEALAVHIVFLG